MTYTVKVNTGVKIKIAPESLIEEVLQNVAMILSTTKNTAPLARDVGLPARFVDKPIPVAEAILIAEVLDAIEKHEPRAEVEGVSFERDESTGKVIPRLEVAIKDD